MNEKAYKRFMDASVFLLLIGNVAIIVCVVCRLTG